MFDMDKQHTLSQLCEDIPDWLEDMEVSEAYTFLEGDFGYLAARYFDRAGYTAEELLSDYGDQMLKFLAKLTADRSQTPLINEHWLSWDWLTWEGLCQRLVFKAVYFQLYFLLVK